MGAVHSASDEESDNEGVGFFPHVVHLGNLNDLSVFQLIQLRQWDCIESRCREDSSLAFVEDDGGSTVLHKVINTSEGQAPLSLIETLLDANPGAAGLQNNYGCTPLHYAAFHYTENDTLATEVLRALLTACPASVKLEDSDGQIPLHNAASISNARMLLRHYPDGISALDNDSKSPIYMASSFCARFINRDEANLDTLSERTVVWGVEPYPVVRPVEFPGARHYQSLRVAYDLACLLIKNSCEADEAHNRAPILHTSLRCSGCPLHFCRMVTWIHPEQLKEPDMFGNYPLHVAVQMMSEPHWPNRVRNTKLLSKQLYFGCFSSSMRKGKREFTDYLQLFIFQLVKQYPQAAKLKNHDKKMPLNLLIESGMTWKAGAVPVLDAHPSAIYSSDVPEKAMPTLLFKVGRDCMLQTMFETVKRMPNLFMNAKPPRRSTRKRHRPS